MYQNHDVICLNIPKDESPFLCHPLVFLQNVIARIKFFCYLCFEHDCEKNTEYMHVVKVNSK